MLQSTVHAKYGLTTQLTGHLDLERLFKEMNRQRELQLDTIFFQMVPNTMNRMMSDGCFWIAQ